MWVAQRRTWVLCSGRGAEAPYLPPRAGRAAASAPASRPGGGQPGLAQSSLSLGQSDKGGWDGQEETPKVLALHFKLRELFPGLSNQQDHWKMGKGSVTLSADRAALVRLYLLAKFNRSCKDRTLGNQGSIQCFVRDFLYNLGNPRPMSLPSSWKGEHLFSGAQSDHSYPRHPQLANGKQRYREVGWPGFSVLLRFHRCPSH